MENACENAVYGKYWRTVLSEHRHCKLGFKKVCFDIARLLIRDFWIPWLESVWKTPEKTDIARFKFLTYLFFFCF